MARIETYNLAASPIAGSDKLIGTDSANNNETKNFSVQEVSDFVKPYKVYVALLTQSGTNPPTAIVLENTLGAITFAYDGTGYYYINSSSLFTSNKTGILFGNTNAGYVKIYSNTTSQLVIEVFDNSGIYTDYGLLNTIIEIRVYQ
jgi:hypothetical protein